MKTQRFLFVVAVCFFSIAALAQKPDSVRQRAWYVPNVVQAQFAGNIGMGSLGLGYELFRQHAQLTFLYGYVPPQVGDRPIHTLALKMNVNLFSIRARSWKVMPYLGFTVNYETGRNSFFTLPKYFPKGYYPTGNAVHATVFAGAKARIPIGKNKIIGYLEPYVESGMSDTNLWYFITERQVNITEAVSMALGVNYVFGKVKLKHKPYSLD